MHAGVLLVWMAVQERRCIRRPGLREVCRKGAYPFDLSASKSLTQYKPALFVTGPKKLCNRANYCAKLAVSFPVVTKTIAIVALTHAGMARLSGVVKYRHARLTKAHQSQFTKQTRRSVTAVLYKAIYCRCSTLLLWPTLIRLHRTRHTYIVYIGVVKVGNVTEVNVVLFVGLGFLSSWSRDKQSSVQCTSTSWNVIKCDWRKSFSVYSQ